MELMKASYNWSTRPDDGRFLSLPEMHDHFADIHRHSRETVVSTRDLEFRPAEDNKGLLCHGPNGHGYAPTHWAFGQFSQLAEAPAGYLRTLPSPIAADCLNYGLHFKRSAEDVGILLQKNGDSLIRAATGPKYGRIWNDEVTSTLIAQFGDGVTGDFRIPGIFGKALTEITKANTTLFGGDKSMFVFLADEKNRIEIPNRRNGQPGSLARGFFIWNSEVRAETIGWATFLFDFVCMNRIVWGVQHYSEIKLRHTASAPDRWHEEIMPALEVFARTPDPMMVGAEQAIATARETHLGDKLDGFLANRFGKKTAENIKLVHFAEESRPIETVWDVVTGATAYARAIPHQDDRIEIETKAGELLAV